MHKYRLSDDDLESSSAEKALGVLVDTKLTMSQKSEGQWLPWLHSHQIDKGDPTPMHDPIKTHLECCAQCWATVQEKHKHTEMSPENCYER